MLMLHRIRKRALLALAILLVCAMPTTAFAADAKKDTAKDTSKQQTGADTSTQAVIQGYASETPLQNGMIVQILQKDSKTVKPLTTDGIMLMHGVVVPANGAAVTLSNDGNKGQVFVATYGRFEVLVSNQNGPIKAGDYITISSLAGVGMKVGATQPFVLGKAATDFTGSGNVASTAKLKDAAGKEVTVSIGRIVVDITITHNPLQESADKNLPTFLKEASRTIANKPVSTTKVYLSLVILIVTTVVAGGMLYSGIRGGLIAIGRNPLAKKSIAAGIFRVVLSGVIVFIIGLFGVYLLLKL